jgi:hypothetical protein
MEPIQLMIENLGRDVARVTIKSAEWEARALVAEAALAEIAAAEEATEDEAPTLAAVPDAPEETEEDQT